MPTIIDNITNDNISIDQWDVTSWNNPSGFITVSPRKPGSTDIIVQLLDDNGRVLYENSCRITVNASYYLDIEKTFYYIKEGEKAELPLMVRCIGNMQLDYKTTNPRMRGDSWKLNLTPVNSGEATVEVTLLDPDYEILYQKSITVKVSR